MAEHLDEWRRIADLIPANLSYWDTTLHNVFANNRYQKWFDLEPHQIYGKHVEEVIGHERFVTDKRYMDGALAGEPQEFLIKAVDRFGRPRFARANLVPDIQDGQVVGFAVLVVETTELMLERAKVSHERARYELIVDSIPECLLTSDNAGLVDSVNPAARRMLGLGTGEWQPTPIDDVVRLLDTNGDPVSISELIAAVEGGVTHVFADELQLRDAGGEVIDVELTVARLGAVFEGISTTLAIRDVTAARAIQREIERLAVHDELTGLLNRNVFAELQKAKAPAENWVVFLDLDHFKAVNDTYGHAAGDRVLQGVADTLRACVRSKQDLVIRQGGDEFVVVLVDCKRATAETIAKRIVIEIAARRTDPDNPQEWVTASVGISKLESFEQLDDAIAAADAAAYRAKQSGGDRYVENGA